MPSLPQELLTSIIFIAFLWASQVLLIRMVRGKKVVLSKEQRRWINLIKNGILISALLALTLIWAPQLQTFALSLTAFAVALVVATKEMILCMTGSLLRISTQPYKVGDWVTMDGITGEVVDINAFSTTIEEIDTRGKTYTFTGTKVTMPNSKLFTSTVENQNFIKSFLFHDLSVAVQYPDVNPVELSKILAEITELHIAPSHDDAVKFARRVSRKAGIDIPEPAPSYGFRTSELGHFIFSARVFVPTREADRIGMTIIQEFLARVYEIRQAREDERILKEAAARHAAQNEEKTVAARA